MPREIVSISDIKRAFQGAEASKANEDNIIQLSRDSYFDRLFKYIPAELVAGYIFVQGVLKNLTDAVEISILQWTIFSLFCLLTPLYLWRVQKVSKIQQHIISFVSFVVWCFALGGPFAMYSWYNPVYGEILLPVFTLLVAIWEAEN